MIFLLSCLLLGAGCTPAPQTSSTSPSESENSQTSLAYTDTMTPSNSQTWTYQGELPADKIEHKQVRVTTEKGDIVFELLPDVAPVTVSNFVYLAAGGFYDGLTFHRREEGFVIQGGDPLGNGMGGPGYTIPAEFNNLKHDRGMVAMARATDPNSAGSQFYITLAPANFLDNNYTVFGRVLEGMDIVDQIKVGDVMTKVVIEDQK